MYICKLAGRFYRDDEDADQAGWILRLICVLTDGLVIYYFILCLVGSNRFLPVVVLEQLLHQNIIISSKMGPIRGID